MVAAVKYEGDNGVVMIDLEKVPKESILDISRGVPNGWSRVNRYASKDAEVLIRGHVEPESIIAYWDGKSVAELIQQTEGE